MYLLTLSVLVPFYRGAVVFDIGQIDMYELLIVLVPFYRGAVVFEIELEESKKLMSSRPLLSRSGCIYLDNTITDMFQRVVLVPFYRGAVVFIKESWYSIMNKDGSRPLLSRSGCI